MSQNKPLVSIIIPVFNQKTEFFDKCIKSAINQDYENLEIIIVDDGSTDATGDYCDKWSEIEKRIIVIHQENKRQGAARNAGLDIAKGEYIFFLDSDDWIEPNTLSYLYSLLIKYNADIATCRGFKQLSSGEIIKYELEEEIKVLSLVDAYDCYVYEIEDCGHSPCDKLYAKHVFENARFVENSYYEDLATIYKFISNAKMIVSSNKYLYCYLDNLSSTMHKRFSPHEFDKIQIYYNLSKFFGNTQFIGRRDAWRKEMEKQSVYCAIKYLLGVYKQKDKNIYHETIEKTRDICKNIVSPLSFRLEIVRNLIIFSPRLFNLVWRTYQKFI